MQEPRGHESVIRPFIDTLYSIAIGIGFSQFPKYPLKNVPGVIFFLLTLVVAVADWYYCRACEDAIQEGKRFRYYLLQVTTVLVLSQMFRHSARDSLRMWIVYFAIFTVLGAYWIYIASFRKYDLFILILISILMIIANGLLLVFHSQIEEVFRFGVKYRTMDNSYGIIDIDYRYVIFSVESALLGVGYLILRFFNRQYKEG